MKISISIPGRPTRWMRPGQAVDGDGEVFRYTDPKVADATSDLKWEAKRAYGLRRPHLGPVVICIVAVFAIPPSWPRARREAALEGRVWHTSDPDLDQLTGLVLDALKGVAYIDDNQVCGYHPNTAKRYGHPERTDIDIYPLFPEEAAKSPGQRRLEAKLSTDGWEALLAPPRKPRKRSKVERQESRDAANAARIRAGGRGRPFRPRRGPR